MAFSLFSLYRRYPVSSRDLNKKAPLAPTNVRFARDFGRPRKKLVEFAHARKDML
jgi:hypothetical protein